MKPLATAIVILLLASRGACAAEPTPADVGLRRAYVAEVTSGADLYKYMRLGGLGEEQAARALHAWRRGIGREFKGRTSPAMQAEISKRNRRLYGDPLGPSVEYLRAQGKSWRQIAEGAARPGGEDLGLEHSIVTDRRGCR